MAGQQRSHDIFRDGIFMAKAIGQLCMRRQASAVDAVSPSSRCLQQFDGQGAGHACVQADPDHHVGRFKMLFFTGLVEALGDHDNLVRVMQKPLDVCSKIGGVVAVEDYFQNRLHGAFAIRWRMNRISQPWRLRLSQWVPSVVLRPCSFLPWFRGWCP